MVSALCPTQVQLMKDNQLPSAQEFSLRTVLGDEAWLQVVSCDSVCWQLLGARKFPPQYRIYR